MADYRKILWRYRRDISQPCTNLSGPHLESTASQNHAHFGSASLVIDVAAQADVKHEDVMLKSGASKINRDENVRKLKTGEPGGSEDCSSDASSVCSEHSNKVVKSFKRVRKGWKNCPIHAKGPKHSREKRAARREEQRRLREAARLTGVPLKTIQSSKESVCNPLENDSEGAEPLLCTCKIVTKERTKPRPEPEGGQSKDDFMDEYERIIYGCEPIFSDTEDNPAVDEQIDQEMERYHKRTSANPDIFATAMMVTSTTMMKFAIIQAELKNLMQVALKRV